MPDLPLVPEEEGEEEKEEEHDDDEKGDSKPRAKRNHPRNRRVNDGDYTEQNDTDDEDDNDDSMKPRAKKKSRSKKTSSTSTNALTRVTNSLRFTNESKIEIIKYVESYNGQYGAMSRAHEHFGITRGVISKIMNNKQHIINAVETGSKKQCKGPYSKGEINQLRELVNQHGEDWSFINGIMHRSENSLKEKFKQISQKDKCVNVNDFRNLPIELKGIINDVGYAYHISSTGPSHFAAYTQQINQHMTDRMVTERTIELDEYLEECQDTSAAVIIPASQLESSGYDFSGHIEREHPHLWNKVSETFRCTLHDYVYCCVDLFEAINKYRFGLDRTMYYGPKGSHNKWFYIHAIDPDTFKMLNFQPVGLGYVDMHFKKSDCPVKVHSCFKVTYDGNDLSNASFKKVYPK
jgi:hypothetical protein